MLLELLSNLSCQTRQLATPDVLALVFGLCMSKPVTKDLRDHESHRKPWWYTAHDIELDCDRHGSDWRYHTLLTDDVCSSNLLNEN